MQQAARQFSGIFISYRRDDSAGHAGRLLDRLSAHFGEDQVFMDIDYIEPGEDFVQVIENAVGSCEVLIAVIGRHWLSSTDGTSRRLDNPNDFVRLEIGAALDRRIRVIPVLVQGATIPRPQDLPDDLSALSRRNALELSDLRWRHDVERLIRALEKIIAERQERRQRESEEEAERRRLAAEAQSRQAEEERRLRQQAEEEARRKHEAEEAEQRGRETEKTRHQRREVEGRASEHEIKRKISLVAATRRLLTSLPLLVRVRWRQLYVGAALVLIIATGLWAGGLRKLMVMSPALPSNDAKTVSPPEAGAFEPNPALRTPEAKPSPESTPVLIQQPSPVSKITERPSRTPPPDPEPTPAPRAKQPERVRATPTPIPARNPESKTKVLFPRQTPERGVDSPLPMRTPQRDVNPSGLSRTVTIDVDPTTGLAAAETCLIVRAKTFIIGSEPRRRCGPQYHTGASRKKLYNN